VVVSQPAASCMRVCLVAVSSSVSGVAPSSACLSNCALLRDYRVIAQGTIVAVSSWTTSGEGSHQLWCGLVWKCRTGQAYGAIIRIHSTMVGDGELFPSPVTPEVILVCDDGECRLPDKSVLVGFICSCAIPDIVSNVKRIQVLDAAAMSCQCAWIAENGNCTVFRVTVRVGGLDIQAVNEFCTLLRDDTLSETLNIVILVPLYPSPPAFTSSDVVACPWATIRRSLGVEATDSDGQTVITLIVRLLLCVYSTTPFSNNVSCVTGLFRWPPMDPLQTGGCYHRH
jgi:hypothetical protein